MKSSKSNLMLSALAAFGANAAADTPNTPESSTTVKIFAP